MGESGQTPPITAEMVARAVATWYGTEPDDVDPEDNQACFDGMREVLEAALAGRTVLELPEPADVQDERGATWTVKADGNETSFTAFRHWDDNSPVVETDFAIWDPVELRAYCLAGLAASENALGLATEAVKSGE